ncbi:MAG TPA: TatD family hydrolase [Phnomibacter sp.]|nr:TatD family hydrolase [Phnomibacter sp.]
MTIIDTHTHLYQPAFDADRAEMIARAKAIGVERFYMPGIDSEVIERMVQTEITFPECIMMPGLHPCSVQENYKEELSLVEAWLGKKTFPALGEIGLDFYWDRTHEALQFEAFRIQIEWALQYKLPIVIHTRNAMQETINVVKEYKGRGLRGIFHCFSGSIESARQIIDAGFLLGIGGVVTYKNGGLPEVLAKVPLQHLVLETDAPYLTPVPFRGKRNESSYLSYVMERLATVYQTDLETIAAATTENARGLFNY